jgi:hypothetical protein
MSTQKDYLGETLRLVERGRGEVYFRTLDQQLIAHMRQQEAAHSTAATGHNTYLRRFSCRCLPSAC